MYRSGVVPRVRKILSSSTMKKKLLSNIRSYDNVQVSRHSSFVEVREGSVSAYQQLAGCLETTWKSNETMVLLNDSSR